MQIYGDEDELPEEINDWFGFEEDAKDKEIKIW